MVPTGIATSVSAKPTGVSPVRHTPTTPTDPPRSTTRAAHQHAPPRSWSHHGRLTMELEAGPMGLRGSTGNEERQHQQPRGRRQPPPPSVVTDQTQQEEQTRHKGLVELDMALEAPVTVLKWAHHRLHNPSHELHLRPPEPL